MRCCILKIFLGICLVGFFNCAATEKYGDLKQVLKTHLQDSEAFFKAIHEVKNPNDLSKAILRYAERLKDLKAKIRNLEQKYPELKQSKKPPEGMKELVGQLAKLYEQIKKAIRSTQFQEWMKDPAVSEAMKQFFRSMH